LSNSFGTAEDPDDPGLEGVLVCVCVCVCVCMSVCMYECVSACERDKQNSPLSFVSHSSILPLCAPSHAPVCVCPTDPDPYPHHVPVSVCDPSCVALCALLLLFLTVPIPESCV
jgi:hypothetical protein